MNPGSAAGTGPAGPGRTRASDAEREEFARTIRDGVGAGRLTLDEGDQRLAAVYAAKYRDELPPLVADLPQERRAPGSQSGGGRARRTRRGLPRLVPAAVVAAVLLGVWALSGGGFFWPAIPLLFLALVILRCGPRFGRYESGFHMRRHPFEVRDPRGAGDRV